MTDEKIRVQIVASPSEAIVQTFEHSEFRTVAQCGRLVIYIMPGHHGKFSGETQSAMLCSANNAMAEAERLENQLNTPPEPPAPTLREAAEKARRLMESEDGVDARVWNAAIAQLQQALEAEGGDE